ncbi:hypothetical protein ACFPPD_13715 [Cohnella suwonensis]|uniref:DUF559 domain-containing protein n=1 Tax=Cohnella suwonensis TaxID=696072 RepID=A0ABW0LZ14_9BACL
MFEKEFERYFEEQIRAASGRRLEMLRRNLTGEIRLLKEVVWPVIGTLDGLEMEYEMVGLTGVRIYGDLFYRTLGAVIECEGFVSHAETVTRDRFDFEQMRIRTIAQYGYAFVPFSWDEIDKRPEVCRRQLYAILGKRTSKGDATHYGLSVNEREMIRYARSLRRPFGYRDAGHCLQAGKTASIQLLRLLWKKGLIRPLGASATRIHAYELEEAARQLVL